MFLNMKPLLLHSNVRVAKRCGIFVWYELHYDVATRGGNQCCYLAKNGCLDDHVDDHVIAGALQEKNPFCMPLLIHPPTSSIAARQGWSVPANPQSPEDLVRAAAPCIQLAGNQIFVLVLSITLSSSSEDRNPSSKSFEDPEILLQIRLLHSSSLISLFSWPLKLAGLSSKPRLHQDRPSWLMRVDFRRLDLNRWQIQHSTSQSTKSRSSWDLLSTRVSTTCSRM